MIVCKPPLFVISIVPSLLISYSYIAIVLNEVVNEAGSNDKLFPSLMNHVVVVIAGTELSIIIGYAVLPVTVAISSLVEI